MRSMTQQDLVEAVGALSLSLILAGAIRVIGHAYHIPVLLGVIACGAIGQVVFMAAYDRWRQRRGR